MLRRVTFSRLRANDLLEIADHPLFPTQYGLSVGELTYDEAHSYASGRFAWAAHSGTVAIAALGVAETFEGAAGLAWAFLSADLTQREKGEVTRFARQVVIGENPLPRIEAVVRCRDPEISSADDQRWLVPHCLAEPTPQLRWALAVGLQPVAVLRKFGAASETHMLMELIR